jgi:hypothetical protein
MDHMSKHPGPWTMKNNVITDAHGEVVADDCNLVDTIDEQGNLLVSNDDARRLILAAPELLEVLKEYGERVSVDCIRGDGNEFTGRVSALIDRIEKGST